MIRSTSSKSSDESNARSGAINSPRIGSWKFNFPWIWKNWAFCTRWWWISAIFQFHLNWGRHFPCWQPPQLCRHLWSIEETSIVWVESVKLKSPFCSLRYNDQSCGHDFFHLFQLQMNKWNMFDPAEGPQNNQQLFLNMCQCFPFQMWPFLADLAEPNSRSLYCGKRIRIIYIFLHINFDFIFYLY